MSLSPWDLSGQLSFNFDFYRPRRPSYVFATRASRQRNESYRHATRTDNEAQEGRPDFIEGIQSKNRKASYRAATQTDEYQLQNLTGDGEGPVPEGRRVFGRQHRRNLSNHFDNLPDIPELKESRSKASLDRALSLDSRDGVEVDTKSTGGRSTGGGPSRRQSSVATVVKTTDFQCKKNLVVLSVSFLLVFTAFRAIQNLQSSINSANKLGQIAMGCVHGTMFLTCLFAPVLINKLTAKWTIVLGLLFYLFWIAANFYPHFYTLVPTSIGVGFGQSLAWGAQVTYIQKLAVDYAHISREITQQQLFKFNGIFLALFQTSHIWGNLVSSLMLDNSVFEEAMSGDYLDIEAGAVTQKCGNYDKCTDSGEGIWNVTAGGSPSPATSLVLKLMGSFLVFSFTGFCLILLALEKIGAKIDPEKTCKEYTSTGADRFTLQFKMTTISTYFNVVWTNVSLLTTHKLYRMLTPLLIFNGFEQGFIYADYTKSYVTCTIGIQMVGLNMITMGVVNSIFSIIVGLVSRYVPREAIIGVGAILQTGLMVFLLVWIPDKDLLAVFFVISALWGICDAVWQTQCNYLVFLCCTDPSEHDVAFQNYRMLQGFGASCAFFLGAFVCVSIKLYILISLLVVATLGYVVVEIQLKKMEFGDYDDNEAEQEVGGEKQEMNKKGQGQSNHCGEKQEKHNHMEKCIFDNKK